MANFIGIDLGTSFSAVAVLDENGKPTIVYNRDGQNATPSCVMVEGESASVGEDARRQWGVDPENVAARFKRDMGTDRHYVLNARSFSADGLERARAREDQGRHRSGHWTDYCSGRYHSR